MSETKRGRGRPKKVDPESTYTRLILVNVYSRDHNGSSKRIWLKGWFSDQFDIIPNREYDILNHWLGVLTGKGITYLDLQDKYEPGDNLL